MPNSIAAIMTFIVHSRRIKKNWTLERFHKRFYCQISKEGYATFFTTSRLEIEGQENKIEGWKRFFCRVSSPVDIDIPREPSREKVEPPVDKDKLPAGKKVLKLDIRQYVKDRRVLLKTLYPENYRPVMSLTDWELSDQQLENLPKRGHSYREPEGRTKGKSKLERIQRIIQSVRELPGGAVTTVITAEEANLASTSGAREESEQVPLRLEDAPEEAEEEEERPLKRRRRLVKGKKPKLKIPLEFIVDAAADICPPGNNEEASEGVRVINPKVVIDLNKDKAYVDLNEDWYPSGSCPPGTAQSMGAVLYSENLFKHLAEFNLSEFREEFARQNAIAWCMGNLLGIRLEEEHNKVTTLKEKIIDIEEDNSMLVARNREKYAELKKKDAVYEQSLSNLAKGYEESTKDAVERVKLEYEQRLSDYKKQMTVIKSSNKRLKKKLSEVEEEAAGNVREGISLCLDNLYQAGVIPLEWKDVERIESLAMNALSKEEKEAMAALAAEDIEEEKSPSDNDAASAT